MQAELLESSLIPLTGGRKVVLGASIKFGLNGSALALTGEARR